MSQVEFRIYKLGQAKPNELAQHNAFLQLCMKEKFQETLLHNSSSSSFQFFSSSDFDNKHQLKLYYYHTRQLLELYLLDETLLGKNQRQTYLKGNNTIYFLINNISSLFIFYSFNCCDSVFLNLENYFFFCIMIIIFIQPRSILNWSATKQ